MTFEERIILDLCGGTGSWSKPYLEAGYTVHNITLPEYDVRTWTGYKDMKIHGILAAPPCTMFSFARTNARLPRDLKQGMETVEACLKIIWYLQYEAVSNTTKFTRLKFWALENPYYGLLKNFLGIPVFVFNPYDFGDPYQKKTALWGNFNIPKLNPIQLSDEMKRLAKSNSYLHRIGTKFDVLKTRDISPENYGKLSWQVRRSITPRGFANAFFKANP